MTTYEEELYDWEGYNSHVDELEQVEEAKGFISEALDCLYGNKSLEHLEFALENACAYLDIPFPKEDLKVQKVNYAAPHAKDYFDFGASLARGQAVILNRTQETGE